jgi:hypothetical protein
MTIHTDEWDDFSPKLLAMYKFYKSKQPQGMDYAMWLMCYRNTSESTRQELRDELRMHEGDNLLAMDNPTP